MRSVGSKWIIVGLLLVSATPSIAEWPTATDTLAIVLLDSLQVGYLDFEIAEAPELASAQLWDLFANRALIKRYAQIEVPGGASVWPIFRDRLIAVAESSEFDSASLKSVLSTIESEEPHLTTKGQLIPIGAFFAHRAGEPVWVIPCAWESGYRPPKGGEPFPLRVGHVRAWAFLAESGLQVGYTTCK